MTTIKLKNGSGAPTAGDLVQGEPALDLTNKRLYTENASGTVIEVGTNPTSLTTGTFTSTGIDDNATSTAITIDSNENVGIGTSSPVSPIHVQKSTGSGGVAIAQFRDESPASGGNGLLVDVTNTPSAYVADFRIGNNSKLRIDSSGNVGIGTSSPSEELHLSKSASGADVCARIQNSAVSSGDTATLRFSVTSNSSFDSAFVGSDRNNALILGSNAAERMRIDSSGNLLVGGKTTLSDAVAGHAFAGGSNAGLTYHTADGTIVMSLNRLTSDGSILRFVKDGSAVGSIGSVAGVSTYIHGGTGYSGVTFGNDEILPCNESGATRDNAIDLGDSTGRFDDIYATNALIQTSDRNEKQDIAELSDAEQRVAKACKGLLRKFRWKDAVEEKGDDARIHFGIIAQDLQSAFEAEGLDAGDYAMFISSTWYEKEITVDAVEAVYEDVVVTPAQEAGFREVSPEVQAEPAYYDVDGNEIKAAVEYQAAVHEATEAVEEVTEQRLVSEAKEAYTYTDTSEEPKEGYTERTRMGVRYPELLSFIIAAI